ncbi:MAG: PTS sugar transporter subunit IIA [Candidatus Cloacimonadales bacterium]|jgi:CBS domain-containing protein|nr:PTS sugar transporter subunit IIA [Candidatus Cloacimonadota bacterium]MDX9977457.1 PTS sugar transporter subunit IIA [Candidatus Cloacimonadales bacterium]
MAIFQLSSLLNKNLIKINTSSKTLEEAYQELLEEICDKFKLPLGCDELFDRIIARDKEASTVFPTGVAIPHARIEDLDDAIIAIAIPKEPIKTKTGPVKMLVMVVSGTRQSTLYLHILQCIIKVSKDTELFNKLLSIKKPEEFINIASDSKYVLTKNVTVADIMTTNIFFAKDDMTIKELGNLFHDNKFGFAPVLDKNNKFVGEVTILELLMSAFPDYTNYLGNLQFLKTFEPFERLLKDENKILVRDVMRETDITLSPDSTLIEALFTMKKSKRRHLPIVVKDKVVGIISFTDIFKKVIKG